MCTNREVSLLSVHKILRILRGYMMFREEPEVGVAAFLVWQAPGLLVGGCWMLLGQALQEQTPIHRTS